MGKLESEKLSQVLSSTIWGECFQSHNAKDVHREKPHYRKQETFITMGAMADALENEYSCSPMCDFMCSHSPSSERWRSSSLHQRLCFPCFISRKENTDVIHLGLEDLGPSANFMIRLWCRDCWWGEKHSCGFFLWECKSPRRDTGLRKAEYVLIITVHLDLYSEIHDRFFSQLIFPPVIACGG